MPLTSTHKTLPTIVAAISANPAPVLAVDTCGILDVVRSQYRSESPTFLLEKSIGALGAALAIPAQLHLLTTDEISSELQRNLGGELAKLHKHIETLLQTGKTLFPDSIFRAWQDNIFHIEHTLSAFPDSWLSASKQVPADAVCVARARLRLAKGDAPGRRGSQIGDCVVTEHLLEVSRSLRSLGFSRPIIFVSSNKKDYGATILKAPLDAEFLAAGVDYHASIEDAISQLGF